MRFESTEIRNYDIDAVASGNLLCQHLTNVASVVFYSFLTSCLLVGLCKFFCSLACNLRRL